MFEKIEESARRKIGELAAAEAELRAKLAEITKEARSTKTRLASTTKHENWHVRRLAHLDRLKGYDGEMASARIYVRSLPWPDYLAALMPYAEVMPDADNLAIEVAAVKDNLGQWDRLGDEIVLERERVTADADYAGWEAWQKKNPSQQQWRTKLMTSRQFFLVSRTADQLSIIAPPKMNRGEAHDWLSSHGANLRLARGRGEGPGTQHSESPSLKDIDFVEPPASVDRGITDSTSVRSDINGAQIDLALPTGADRQPIDPDRSRRAVHGDTAVSGHDHHQFGDRA